MRLARVLLLSAVGATTLCSVAACRGILGIEQLEFDAGGGGERPAPDASPDVRSGDDGSPVGSDAGASDAPTADAADAGCGKGAPCFDCCRMTSGMPAIAALTMLAGMPGANGSCLCGPGGACEDACASTVCSGSMSMPMPSQECNTCFQNALFPPTGTQQSAACAGAVAECEDSGTCAPAAECMKSCNP